MSITNEMMDGMYVMGQIEELITQIPSEAERAQGHIDERVAFVAERKIAADKIKELITLLRQPENADKVLVTNDGMATLLERWLEDLSALCWAFEALNDAEKHVREDLLGAAQLQPMMEELRGLLKQIPDALLMEQGE